MGPWDRMVATHLTAQERAAALGEVLFLPTLDLPFHSGCFCVSGCPCRFEQATTDRPSCLGSSRLAFWCFFSCDHLAPGQDINVQFKQQQRVDPM